MERQRTLKLDNLYCLVLRKDGRGTARTIEFEGSSADSALVMAGRHCQGRKAEVYENGASLCTITSDAADSFWVIAPPVAASRPSAIQ